MALHLPSAVRWKHFRSRTHVLVQTQSILWWRTFRGPQWATYKSHMLSNFPNDNTQLTWPWPRLDFWPWHSCVCSDNNCKVSRCCQTRIPITNLLLVTLEERSDIHMTRTLFQEKSINSTIFFSKLWWSFTLLIRISLFSPENT